VTAAQADSGSFRDRSGRVFRHETGIFRTVMERAAADYEFVRDSGLIDKLSAEGIVLSATEIDRSRLGAAGATARYLVEHPLLRFISYPYEWPFPALKAAALLHLEVQLAALDAGVSLSDASAYNVQFVGTRPVFIDHLSFRRYREGEIWSGYRQFCEQFLNPLLLRAILGIPHNAWYRGTQEGIPTSEINRLIPLRRKLSWNMLSSVVLQATLEKTSRNAGKTLDTGALRHAAFPKASYRSLLRRLRLWIEKLEPADTGATVWRDYAATHSYASDEVAAKKAFVAAMAASVKPRMLWDLGCNSGDYSKAALDAGAAYAVGFDFDQGALEAAFARGVDEKLHLLPLVLDAANPSPSQGWAETERKGLTARASADAVLALAFVHHLAIGRNVPLDQLVGWLIDLAPTGVIEFVPKADPMLQHMLRLREDIFDDYSEEHFTAAVAARARIVRSVVVSASGRRLVWFDRTQLT
jgi:ribosomal protein L11 methylase PrmA